MEKKKRLSMWNCSLKESTSMFEIGYRLGKGYVKAVYHLPAYLTYMQCVCVSHSVVSNSL